jgi:hypothetical protein
LERVQQRLMAVIRKEPSRELGLQLVTSADASLLALIWAHLEVKQGGSWWRPGSEELEDVRVVATHNAVYGTPRADLGEPGAAAVGFCDSKRTMW